MKRTGRLLNGNLWNYITQIVIFRWQEKHLAFMIHKVKFFIEMKNISIGSLLKKNCKPAVFYCYFGDGKNSKAS